MSDTFGADLKSGQSPTQLTIAQENHVVLVMANPGDGKTYLLAGWRKRLLVQQTDPPEKALSYENAGYLPTPVQHGKFCDFQDFYSPNNTKEWCTRVEFLGEDNPLLPRARERFEARIKELTKDIREWGVRTVGYDGITSGGESARFYNEYKNHPADYRLNYGAERYFLDKYVKLFYTGLVRYCNIVILSHITDEFIEEGEKGLRTPRKLPSGPGRFAETVNSKFAEVWRIYTNDAGQYILQTKKRPGLAYGCMSLRDVPDGMVASYKNVDAYLTERRRRQEALVKKEGA